MLAGIAALTADGQPGKHSVPARKLTASGA
jgi:hypothetical protein